MCSVCSSCGRIIVSWRKFEMVDIRLRIDSMMRWKLSQGFTCYIDIPNCSGVMQLRVIWQFMSDGQELMSMGIISTSFSFLLTINYCSTKVCIWRSVWSLSSIWSSCFHHVGVAIRRNNGDNLRESSSSNACNSCCLTNSMEANALGVTWISLVARASKIWSTSHSVQFASEDAYTRQWLHTWVLEYQM